MRWLGAVVAVALAVSTVSCGSDTTQASERSSEPKDVTQTIDPAVATKLALGDTLQVVADLPKELDGDRVYFSSYASDRELVGSVVPDDVDPAASGASAQSRPVLYDLDTQRLTVLDHGARSEPTWVADVVGNDDTVVWVEGADYNIAHSDYTIHALDRATGEVKVIGDVDDHAGKIAYGNDLDVRGRTAYFSTVTFPGREGKESVFAIPVDGSTPPEVLVAGGQRVRIDGDTLRYWVRNPRDQKEYPRHYAYDLPTGRTTPVPVDEHADDDGFCGAEVTDDWRVWCTGHIERPGPEGERDQPRLTIRETSGRTTAFKPFPVGSLNSPIPHDVVDLGRWTGISVPTDDGQQREFLVDLDSREIRVFPDNTSFDRISPDRKTVLVSSFGEGKNGGRQRIVTIPTG